MNSCRGATAGIRMHVGMSSCNSLRALPFAMPSGVLFCHDYKGVRYFFRRDVKGPAELICYFRQRDPLWFPYKGSRLKSVPFVFDQSDIRYISKKPAFLAFALGAQEVCYANISTKSRPFQVHFGFV